eukprot:GILJ01006921.1.p1 GENE.GILJ01006921.1~~GILJ01006921.1.p1  ORF type:complete len:353 (-),score=29.65 GILJ01006921.1:122-1180(-)
MATLGDDYLAERLLSLANLRRRERSSRRDAQNPDNVGKLLAAIPTWPYLIKQHILLFLPPVNRKFAAQQGPRWEECDRLGMHYCLFFPRDNVGVCKFPAVCATPANDVDTRRRRRIPTKLFADYPHEKLFAVSWKLFSGASLVEVATAYPKTKQDEYSSFDDIIELIQQLYPSSRYYWLPCLVDVCRWLLGREHACDDTQKSYLICLRQFLRTHIQPLWHALFDRHEQLNDTEVLRSLILGDFYEIECEEWYSCTSNDDFAYVLKSCNKTLDNCEHLEDDCLAWTTFLRQHLFEDIYEAIQAEIVKSENRTCSPGQLSCAEFSDSAEDDEEDDEEDDAEEDEEKDDGDSNSD